MTLFLKHQIGSFVLCLEPHNRKYCLLSKKYTLVAHFKFRLASQIPEAYIHQLQVQWYNHRSESLLVKEPLLLLLIIMWLAHKQEFQWWEFTELCLHFCTDAGICKQ